MTIQEFQRIVIRLSNQMHVRHYLWLNYPHEPQVMALSLVNWMGSRGTLTDGGVILRNELNAIGFDWDSNNSYYAISRKEDAA